MPVATLLRRALSRVFPARRMRRDWDARARENASRYIDCAHSGSDEDFWRSGAADLETLVLQDVTLDASARVLEIGCGVGRLLRPLSLRVERAIGIDISPEMISRARAALCDRPNVELSVTGGDLAGIPDASLDFVYSFIVFQHVPSRAAVLRYLGEAARALKAGGVLRFQVDGRRRSRLLGSDTWRGAWFDADRLRRQLSRMGFEVIDRWGEGTQYLWITARRAAEPGRPATAAAAIRGRAWNEPELERALSDLRLPAREAASVVSGRRSLRELAQPFLRRNRLADPRDFVRRAYEVFLGRPADTDGLSFYVSEISSGTPRGYVLDCLIASAEAKERFRRREARASGDPGRGLPVSSPAPR
ncbi:MAG: methyltransferase domain-containing protein [Acidobacteriota bacterium]